MGVTMFPAHYGRCLVQENGTNELDRASTRRTGPEGYLQQVFWLPPRVRSLCVLYVCIFLFTHKVIIEYFYLNWQVHTGYKPNYMEANVIMFFYFLFFHKEHKPGSSQNK